VLVFLEAVGYVEIEREEERERLRRG